MRTMLPLVLLLGCPAPEPDDSGDPLVETVDVDTTRARAVRVSMALRGTRPTASELDRIDADPTELDALVDAWLQDPAFGETIRHLHADALLVRKPGALPALGPLTGRSNVEISTSFIEEPLALVERVVMEDRPYTEIVTADWTMADEIGEQMFDGLDREAGSGFQPATFTDGRPAAGLLSTNGLWVRHESNGQNYHRARANAISDALLCTDFLERDVPITGDVDLSDPAVVADALNTQDECVACHQSLDPLASHFFVVRNRLAPFQVQNAYAADCEGRGAASCYPIAMYNPRGETAWERVGLRAPGYFGLASDNLGTLGQQIADDPRFAQCTVRRFVSYFTQTPAAEVPLQTIAPLQARFEDSGFDARDLVRAIVTDPSFLDAEAEDGPGLLAARPFQLAASIEALTGFRYVVNIDGERCRQTGNNCIGDLDMVYDDAFGFRAMAGGIDGFRVTRPTWTTTPTKSLFLAALAEEAAGHVVDTDFAAPAASRRLLDEVEPDTTDEDMIRAQLVALHRRLFGEALEADDVQIDEAYALFEAALTLRSGRPDPAVDAWKVTLTGLLQDPRMLLY